MARMSDEERERRRREARLRQQEEIERLAKEIAAKAPPLTKEQRQKLAELLSR